MLFLLLDLARNFGGNVIALGVHPAYNEARDSGITMQKVLRHYNIILTAPRICENAKV